MLMRYQALLTIVALNPVQQLTSQLSPVEASTNVFSVCTLGEHFTLSYAFKLLDAFLAKSLFSTIMCRTTTSTSKFGFVCALYIFHFAKCYL